MEGRLGRQRDRHLSPIERETFLVDFVQLFPKLAQTMPEITDGELQVFRLLTGTEDGTVRGTRRIGGMMGMSRHSARRLITSVLNKMGDGISVTQAREMTEPLRVNIDALNNLSRSNPYQR